MSVVRINRNRIDVVLDDVVSAAASAVEDLGVIPNNTLWRVIKLGGGEVANGDGKASVIALQISENGTTWTTARAITVVGNTVELQVQREIKGNGTRKVRIVRQNTSSSSKQVIAWLEGYKVE